ncbi:MAG: 50S ribosomal protein L25 [Phycisphaerales bacterium]|nr:MAG: 50S ribosomal protein L25 [Phycisphaerales bacterium]
MQQKTPTIAVLPRERTGTRYARRLRKEGRLPAVIYGHKIQPLHVSVDEEEILAHLHHGAHVMKLKIKGGKMETCLVKELQFGYLGDNVVHIDFARVNLDEEVTVHVHLSFVGESASAAKAGAILKHVMTELEVVCRVSEIPEEIKVDQSNMETVLTVGDVVLPPGIRTNVDPATPVATITFVHREEVTAGEEVEVTEVETEPEVISDVKAEEEPPSEDEEQE